MSLAMHYGKAKNALMGIHPKEATEHAERLLIAGGTGAVLGMMSAGMGGLDHKVFGLEVPIDGLASGVLALAGLSMHSPELLTASIAAGGSASTRTFEKLFKKTFGVHGDFDSNDIPFGFGASPQLGAGTSYGGVADLGQGQFSAGFGFGAERDRLVEAARALDAA